MSFLVNFLTPTGITEFVLILVVFIAIPLCFFWFIRRLFPTILSSILSIFVIIFAALDLFYLFIATICVYLGLMLVVAITNLSNIRSLLVKRFSGKKSKINVKVKKDTSIAKIFDKTELYAIIVSTVKKFSKTKTGAIITFERKDDLKPLMKNGVILNAPVKQELLETIFYEGTRLHDGAVIIKEDKILAASVYYTLTTRPLNGKYGSRHRAAIGISEISDSITIVVSEETGRISIAQGGTIEPVSIESFERIFVDIMEED